MTYAQSVLVVIAPLFNNFYEKKILISILHFNFTLITSAAFTIFTFS